MYIALSQCIAIIPFQSPIRLRIAQVVKPLIITPTRTANPSVFSLTLLSYRLYPRKRSHIRHNYVSQTRNLVYVLALDFNQSNKQNRLNAHTIFVHVFTQSQAFTKFKEQNHIITNINVRSGKHAEMRESPRRKDSTVYAIGKLSLHIRAEY
jgi:hypothetical protein